MHIKNLLIAAILTGTSLISARGALALPLQSVPTISVRSDLVQVHDRWHGGGDRWNDDGDRYDRRDRDHWGDDRRYWRPSRAERWSYYHHRRGWDDGGWSQHRSWMYRY